MGTPGRWMMPSYIVIYYAVAACAMASMPLFIDWRRKHTAPLRTFVVLTVSITYVLGMARRSGVDYANYVRAYFETPHEIFDPGFRLLMSAFRTLGLPFTAIPLLTAVITLEALRRAARFFNVSFGLLLVIYFLHLAVVRDFAQFRSGLAIAVVIFGITSQTRWRRFVLYALGTVVHLTSAALILSYEYCALVARQKNHVIQTVMIGGLVAIWVIVGLSVRQLAFLDPRVEIYLRWGVENYGLPARHFVIIYFHLAIVALAYVTRRCWRDDPQIRTLVFLHIVGIAVFVSFRDVAMFAYRLSSAALSLYPVLLLALLQRLRVTAYGYSLRRLSTVTILLLVGFFMLLREGNVEILQSIGF